MKQEDKDLLLQDLCARLPYKPMVEYKGKTYNVLGIVHGRLVICKPLSSLYEYPLVEEVKLYLFPLSSMTEEQKNELYEMCEELNIGFNSGTFIDMSGYGDIGIHKIQPIINYLLKNHFDINGINGLIPMGLANDATGKNIY